MEVITILLFFWFCFLLVFFVLVLGCCFLGGGRCVGLFCKQYFILFFILFLMFK